MDPIADMIISIKHAGAVSKETVLIPYSKVKLAVARALMKIGLVTSVEKKAKKAKSFLEIGIAYDENSKARVKGVKRISKPSRRMYASAKELKPVRQGYGFTVLSTPKGILTDVQARKEHVGGEVLFSIW